MGRAHGHDRVHHRVRRRARASRGGTCEPRSRISMSVVNASRRREWSAGSRDPRSRRQRVVANRMRRVPDGDAARALDAASVRRSSARHARPRQHLRRRARKRARSADRAFARRDPLGAYLVPPARGVAQGGLSHDCVRPPRSRAVGARRGRSLARQPRARPQDRARTPRSARRGARRSLDGRGRGASRSSRNIRRSRSSASPESCCCRRSHTRRSDRVRPARRPASRSS